jgi:signal transduction histidine kinase
MDILEIVIIVLIGTLLWFALRAKYEAKKLNEMLISHNSLDVSVFKDAQIKQMALQINRLLDESADVSTQLGLLNTQLEEQIRKKAQSLSAKTDDLEKALGAQDKFIKNAIHEINTPIATISANIEMLNLKGFSNKHFTKIEAATKIIVNIYEDMAYFVAKDRRITNKEAIDLSNFLSERIDYFEEIAIGAKQSFNVQMQNGLFIRFDAVQLLRIIDNTLSNAIKYGIEDGIIKIKLYRSHNEKLRLEIINKSHKSINPDKAFMRFWRGESSKGGFGLGLAIVEEICIKNEVGIKVENRDDNNVAFCYDFIDFYTQVFEGHGF